MVEQHEDEYFCRWAEICTDADFDPDAGGFPPVVCHHPEGAQFCDYVEAGDSQHACPYFEYAVPYHEVELRQYLEMVELGAPGKVKDERRVGKPVEYPALSKEAQEAMLPRFVELWRSTMSESDISEDKDVTALILGTLLGSVEAFDDLSTEERVKIFTAVDWFWRWGYLLGRAPEAAAEMFRSVKPLWVEVERPAWFQSVLREYRP